MARRPVTSAVRAASRRNIKKAQLSRYRSREPRRLGVARYPSVRNFYIRQTLRARRII